ncbi:hypothetical protein D3C76_429720 [compost metagenome]
MKWFKHHENHCFEFLEFADNILESEIVTSICEQMCEFGGNDVIIRDKTSLDREGGNHEMVGYVQNGGRVFGFRAVSGNWNGLEILDWAEDELFRLSDRSGY